MATTMTASVKSRKINQLAKELREAGGAEALARAMTSMELPEDSGVGRHDRRDIILPDGMSLAEARKLLLRVEEEYEQPTAVNYRFDAEYRDLLVATSRAINQLLGFGLQLAVYTFFGVRPPELTPVVVGLDENGREVIEKVPAGRIALPGIYSKEDGREIGWIELVEDYGPDYQPRPYIHGYCRKMHVGVVDTLAAMIRTYLREQSIYKGKIVDSQFNHLWLGGFDPQTLVLSQRTRKALESLVLTPIRNPEVADQLGIERKRAGLLVGEYGTGKTMTSRAIAVWAQEAGWTVVVGRPDDKLVSLLSFARLYQPSVILLEDIDAQVKGERDGKVNEILNTVDGVISVRDRVATVMTTNHPEAIHQAMMRPGRTHWIIKLGNLDGHGLKALADHTGMLFEDDIDWDAVADEFPMPPAYLKEGLSRVGLVQAADNRLGEPVSQEELSVALNAMQDHLEMQQQASDGKVKRSDLESSLRSMIAEVTDKSFDDGVRRLKGCVIRN